MIVLAWKLALRDLRHGKRGLVIVMLCLGLGVAAIAAVGLLRSTLDRGIAESGRSILGGDIELSTGLGPFPSVIPAWFIRHGAQITETVDTRSILIAPNGHRLLTALRATGAGWPMLGAVISAPAGQFAGLAHGLDGRPGVLLANSSVSSLRLKPGDPITLGGVPLVFRGTIIDSPDALGDSRLFGAKAFAPLAALAGSPLLEPTGLVTFDLQIRLDQPHSERRLISAFRHDFPANNWQLRTADDADPDLSRFVDDMSLFMTLLGLGALLVGGVGVANGVEAWLQARARSNATLRSLGASARLLYLIQGIQLLTVGVPAILVGLAAGIALQMVVLPLLKGRLPLPAHIYPVTRGLAEAAGFGLLVGLISALPSVGRATAVSGAALLRGAAPPARSPALEKMSAGIQAFAVLALGLLTTLAVPNRKLAFGFCTGAILILLLLRGTAVLLMRGLKQMPRAQRPDLALAIRRLSGPASPLPLMMTSIGAGLTVLVAVAQIRSNLLAEFSAAIPAGAPRFFFIDIQPADLTRFQAALARTRAVTNVQILPSLRARILAVGGTPVSEFHPPSRSVWPLNNDLGFSFATNPPPGTVVTKGRWWPPDYLGPPLVSFDARMAKDWGVQIGDLLTVNVLGRQFTLRIANLRQIDWQSLKLNFLMLATPDPFAGAPYTLIATVSCKADQAGAVLTAVTDALPGVTGIDVGQVLSTFEKLLGEIGYAISSMGAIALMAGILVLISAVAAERESRIAEAVVLKTLGASRHRIRSIWLVEFLIGGCFAGLVAALFGTLAAWLIITGVFAIDWRFQLASTVVILVASIALMPVFGFVSTAGALRKPAAAWLRLAAGS